MHVESIYGTYHGQDPRCFDPDPECCTEKEMAAHKAACEVAERDGWNGDLTDSGCHHAQSEDGTMLAIVCTTAYGIGTYEIVMDEEGDFIRDATFADLQREGEWSEPRKANG